MSDDQQHAENSATMNGHEHVSKILAELVRLRVENKILREEVAYLLNMHAQPFIPTTFDDETLHEILEGGSNEMLLRENEKKEDDPKDAIEKDTAPKRRTSKRRRTLIKSN